MALRVLVATALTATVFALAAPADAAAVDVDSNPPSPTPSRGDITFNPGSIVITQDDEPIVNCAIAPGPGVGLVPSDGCHCDESRQSDDQSGGVTTEWGTTNGCSV